jgi:magnesium chelatase family protein
MGVKVHGIISKGFKGTIIDIECHLSNNLPTIVIVGSASKAVDEARERIRGAFATSRIMLPRKRITVNLAPADLPKADSGFDLAIAVAIWLADGRITAGLSHRQAFIGELGLDGSTRAVRGIIGKLLVGRGRGITTFFIPADNLAQARLVPKVTLVPVRNLEQLYNHLGLGLPITPVKTRSGDYRPAAAAASRDGLQVSEIVGQRQAKRALEIAAAGGHNLFFSGPPGTGKSMLAKAMPSILPPLTREEMLEVTHLHSLAGHDYEKIVAERPFRSPHHSASHVAIVGGGSRLRPGEISLAHRGILFFDELPEFDRDTLEALRQPLEDRVISLARARETAAFPANFIMVATANPCPCGLYGSKKKCKCPTRQRNQYQSRVSGPILDRIDLHCGVHKVEHDRLLSQSANPSEDEACRQRVRLARQLQARRFGNSVKLNADMTNQDVKRLAGLEPEAIKMINLAAQLRGLSARAYMRTVKVARTIADLDNRPAVAALDISEAVNYRPELLNKPDKESL